MNPVLRVFTLQHSLSPPFRAPRHRGLGHRHPPPRREPCPVTTAMGSRLRVPSTPREPHCSAHGRERGRVSPSLRPGRRPGLEANDRPGVRLPGAGPGQRFPGGDEANDGETPAWGGPAAGQAAPGTGGLSGPSSSSGAPAAGGGLRLGVSQGPRRREVLGSHGAVTPLWIPESPRPPSASSPSPRRVWVQRRGPGDPHPPPGHTAVSPRPHARRKQPSSGGRRAHQGQR